MQIKKPMGEKRNHKINKKYFETNENGKTDTKIYEM